MGSTFAQELASEARNSLKLQVALEYHLTGNHFPPLPTSLIPCCIKAIENANNGLWDKKVKLPAPITWKGLKYAPTRECIKAWHLDWFLEQEDIEE